jgi:hypothetical protein
MPRSSSFFFSPNGLHGARSSKPGARGVADFLQTHDRLAALLPAIARIAALQKDCVAILPNLFEHCSVMQFDAGKLVIATPNAALAARLKQQLPRLLEALQNRAWQVSAVRIKVQVGNIPDRESRAKQLHLPPQAVSSLTALNAALEDSPRNQALKTALATLLQRHRRPK